MKTGKKNPSWKSQISVYTIYKSNLSLDFRILPHDMSWTPRFNRNESQSLPGQGIYGVNMKEWTCTSLSSSPKLIFAYFFCWSNTYPSHQWLMRPFLVGSYGQHCEQWIWFDELHSWGGGERERVVECMCTYWMGWKISHCLDKCSYVL